MHRVYWLYAPKKQQRSSYTDLDPEDVLSYHPRPTQEEPLSSYWTLAEAEDAITGLQQFENWKKDSRNKEVNDIVGFSGLRKTVKRNGLVSCFAVAAELSGARRSRLGRY